MRKKKQKRDYECPKCKVHELQIERFICTSVTPSASGSTSPSKQAPSWGEDEEAD